MMKKNKYFVLSVALAALVVLSPPSAFAADAPVAYKSFQIKSEIYQYNKQAACDFIKTIRTIAARIAEDDISHKRYLRSEFREGPTYLPTYIYGTQ